MSHFASIQSVDRPSVEPQRRIGRQPLVRIILAFAILVPLFWGSAAADIVNQTGSVTIPGSSDRVDYRVTVRPQSGGRLGVWIKLSNPSLTKTIGFVICLMVNIDETTQMHRRFTTLVQNGRYICRDDGIQSSTLTKSFHFGCRRFSIPPGGSVFAVDTGARVNPPLVTDTYPKLSDNEIDSEDVATVYFDLLADLPIDPSCNAVQGNNHHLIPSVAPGANVVVLNGSWGQPSVTRMRDRDPGLPNSGFSGRQEFFTFGASTMAITRDLGVRITGSLTGAPEGTEFEIQFPTVDNRGSVAVFGATDESGQATFNADYRLRPNTEPVGTLSLTTPFGAPLPEGSLIRFRGDVVTAEAFGIYEPGDFLFNIDGVFIRDDSPPLIRRSAIVPSGSGDGLFRATVVSSDDLTLVNGARLHLSQDGGLTFQDIEMDFAGRNDADVSTFEAEVGPFSQLDSVIAMFEVLDEVDNSAVSRAEILTGQRYFPQIAEGSDANVEILVSNPTDQAESGSISFFGNDGSPLAISMGEEPTSTIDFEIPAGGSYSVRSQGSGDLRTGYAIVRTPSPDSQLSSIVVYRISGLPTSVTASRRASRQHVAVKLDSERNSGVAFVNPYTSANELRVLLLDDEGSLVGETQVQLAGKGQRAAFVNELFPQLQGEFSGSLHVISELEFVMLGLGQDIQNKALTTLTGGPLAFDPNEAP